MATGLLLLLPSSSAIHDDLGLYLDTSSTPQTRFDGLLEDAFVTSHQKVAGNWHIPILITDNADFRLPTEVSGVVNPNATGTADDPFIIENWVLSPVRDDRVWGVTKSCQSHATTRLSDYSFGWATTLTYTTDQPLPHAVPEGRQWHAIEIRDTDAHVVIRNVEVRPLSPSSGSFQEGMLSLAAESDGLIGIYLKNADNVRIESSVVHGTETERLFRGICARNADNLAIEASVVSRTTYHAIDVRGGSGLTIKDNIVHDSRGYEGLADGVSVIGVSGATVSRNSVTDHRSAGILLIRTSQSEVVSNTVSNSRGDGVYLQGSKSIQIQSNSIRAHADDGVRSIDSTSVHINHNHISDNGLAGVRTNNGYPVDAEYNYWGCSDGPSHTACDSVAGPVDYKPWLKSAPDPPPEPSASEDSEMDDLLDTSDEEDELQETVDDTSDSTNSTLDDAVRLITGDTATIG